VAKRKAQSKTRATRGRKPSVKKSVKRQDRTKKVSKTSERKVASKKVSKTSTKKAKRKPTKKLETRPQKKKAEQAAAGRTAWKITCSDVVVDVDVFSKNGVHIRHERHFWYGCIVVKQKPDLRKYDPKNGINLHALSGDYESGDLGNEKWSELVFPKKFSKKEKERLTKLVEEEGEGILEDEEGWFNDDHETWYYGDLFVEEVEAE
jgi:hypothetical protein